MTDRQISYAASLWNVGCDTADIAGILKVPQAAVYNRMQQIRDAAKAARAAA